MFQPKAIYLNPIRPSGVESYDNTVFRNGLKYIDLYKVTFIFKKTHRTKGYKEIKKPIHIELHHYDGFAMIKFYPKQVRSNPNKFKLRCHELKYSLNPGQLRQLFFDCAYIMKDYLEKNTNNYVGFMGQPDDYDDKRNRNNSQRSNIYNPLVNSLFSSNKYELTDSSELLYQFNIRMIRKIVNDNDARLMSDEQQRNYKNFTNLIIKNAHILPEFLTKQARIRIYGEEVFEQNTNQ